MTTIEAIRAKEEADRKDYEARTVGMRDEDGASWTIAELRTAFDKWHAGDDWKRPVNSLMPIDGPTLVAFCRAVEFFQGDRPDVTITGCAPGMIRVTSRGYQG